MAPSDVNRLLLDLDPPMVVVTTTARDGERSGCLVGFQTPCSVDPPRLAVFLSVNNHTFGVAERADHLGVHYLAPEHRHLAELFGTRTGDDVDKFAHCAWREGPGGVPLLEACPSWIVGRILQRHSTGDHVGYVLEPISAEHTATPLRQLGFQSVRDLRAGHAP